MTQTITIKEPKAPATPNQLSYLKSLVEKHDLPEACERFQLATRLGVLTKGAASELIDQLLKAPKKTAIPLKEQAKTVPSVAVFPKPAPEPQLTECPAFGYYMIDGTLYYWDVTGKDYSPILRRLVLTTTYDGKKKGSWKKCYPGYGAPKVTATFKPYGGGSHKTFPEKTGLVYVAKVFAEAVLAGLKPLSETEAGALGKQFGICIRCGATLTDPVSVANGIGPVCAKYWA